MKPWYDGVGLFTLLCALVAAPIAFPYAWVGWGSLAVLAVVFLLTLPKAAPAEEGARTRKRTRGTGF